MCSTYQIRTRPAVLIASGNGKATNIPAISKYSTWPYKEPRAREYSIERTVTQWRRVSSIYCVQKCTEILMSSSRNCAATLEINRCRVRESFLTRLYKNSYNRLAVVTVPLISAGIITLDALKRYVSIMIGMQCLATISP